VGWRVSASDLLHAFARQRYPGAEVHTSQSTGDFVVTIPVSRKQLLADRTEALRSLYAKMTPLAVRRRRLHWARRLRWGRP